MLRTWVIVVLRRYLGLLFAVAYYGRRRADEGRSIIGNETVYALSLAVYATSWTYYGSVGSRALRRALDEGVRPLVPSRRGSSRSAERSTSCLSASRSGTASTTTSGRVGLGAAAAPRPRARGAAPLGGGSARRRARQEFWGEVARAAQDIRRPARLAVPDVPGRQGSEFLDDTRGG